MSEWVSRLGFSFGALLLSGWVSYQLSPTVLLLTRDQMGGGAKAPPHVVFRR